MERLESALSLQLDTQNSLIGTVECQARQLRVQDAVLAALLQLLSADIDDEVRRMTVLEILVVLHRREMFDGIDKLLKASAHDVTARRVRELLRRASERG